MDVLTFLDTYAGQIAEGDAGLMEKLLHLLAAETLFTPVTYSLDLPDARGSKKVRVVSIDIMGRKVVPTFSREDLFDGWNSECLECLAVTGGDLALAMPDEAGLLLNPGHLHEVFFEPRDVSELAKLVNEGGSREDAVLDQKKNVIAKVSREGRAESLIRELKTLFVRHHGVCEAYYLDASTQDAEGSLGLLTDDISENMRFSLMRRIGEISQRHFDSSGAIEVYTDLSQKASSSWDLFSPLTPFYERDITAGAHLPSQQYKGEIHSEKDRDEEGLEYEVINLGMTSPEDAPPGIDVAQFIERKRARLAEMLKQEPEDDSDKD